MLLYDNKKGQEPHLLSFLFFGQKTGDWLLLLTVNPLANDVNDHTCRDCKYKGYHVHVVQPPFRMPV